MYTRTVTFQLVIIKVDDEAPFYEEPPESSFFEIELGDDQELSFGDIVSSDEELVSVQLFVNEVMVISSDCLVCPIYFMNDDYDTIILESTDQVFEDFSW